MGRNFGRDVSSEMLHIPPAGDLGFFVLSEIVTDPDDAESLMRYLVHFNDL
jgi:hypothetical protein